MEKEDRSLSTSSTQEDGHNIGTVIDSDQDLSVIDDKVALDQKKKTASHGRQRKKESKKTRGKRTDDEDSRNHELLL